MDLNIEKGLLRFRLWLECDLLWLAHCMPCGTWKATRQAVAASWAQALAHGVNWPFLNLRATSVPSGPSRHLEISNMDAMAFTSLPSTLNGAQSQVSTHANKSSAEKSVHVLSDSYGGMWCSQICSELLSSSWSRNLTVFQQMRRQQLEQQWKRRVAWWEHHSHTQRCVLLSMVIRRWEGRREGGRGCG